MYLLIFFFLLPWTTSAAGGGSPQGKWNVTNPNSQLQCIILYAQIDLELSYIVKGTDAQKDVLITVPTSSVVNRAVSSCNQTVSVANHNSADSPVYSQVMQLDLDHMNGWYLKMYFTTDSRIPTDHGKQWAMYRVDVQANYTTQADKFPDAADSGHLYTNQVFLDDDNEFADYIYAPLDNSLYCPSKQKYIINTDNDIGPRATITFSLLNVQAYMTTINPGKAPFGTRQTCPTDQHTTDKVPLIVGGCLAGLIVLVMVLYLVYRACLPKEVIHLVNPHSHHENKAMSIDEDNEDAQHH